MSSKSAKNMKYFVLIVFFSRFLSQNVLSEKIESHEQLFDRKIFDLDKETDDQHNPSSEDPFLNNAACECGPDSRCMWINKGIFGTRKVCVCKPGYYEENGKCVALKFQENYIIETTNPPEGINADSLADEDVLLPQKASCTCKGGKCVKEDGKEVCKCPPGFGNLNQASCKACNCGSNTRCMWEPEMQSVFGGFRKVCLCKPGYGEKSGKCVDCECGPDSNCTFIDQGFFKAPKKICVCKSGYIEEKGICVITETISTEIETEPPITRSIEEENIFTDREKETPISTITEKEIIFTDRETELPISTITEEENIFTDRETEPPISTITEEECDCGPYGLCEIVNGLKKCNCVALTTELDGKCVECNCGDNGYSCYYLNNGTKVCICLGNYINVNGYCKECFCGLYGLCRFEFGRKKCLCSPNFIESNGRCVAIETSTTAATKSISLMTTNLMSTIPITKIVSSESPTVVTSTVSPTTDQECDCGSYGLCEIVDGRKKCKCTPSTIEFNGKCLECNCGKFSKHCSYSANGTKVCDCNSNYINVDGQCKECDCGDNGLCKYEFRRKKCICSPNFVEANGKCQACECGKETDTCKLDSSGKKQCTCFPRYKENNGYCEECYCGTSGSCRFENGLRKCWCDLGYSEKNGTCEYCTCGKKANSCSFDEQGNKRCNCYIGFADKNGNCEECNCGYDGSCKFENGRKRCICKSNTIERNGRCIETTLEPTTSSRSTVLTSTTPGIERRSTLNTTYSTLYSTTDSSTPSTIHTSTTQECDCGSRGRCTFENGQKKCICDPFTSEVDGKCVDCYCGKNSKSCHFNWKGDKVCNCSSGYAEVYGFCYDCNCGVNAKSCLYRSNGYKVCSCDFGYTQTNGYCSAICSEDKCVHGKCKIVDNDFKCRCDKGFTGQRCEEKIQTKSNKQDLWMVLLLTVAFAIFILLSGMFCFWTSILSKISKK